MKRSWQLIGLSLLLYHGQYIQGLIPHTSTIDDQRGEKKVTQQANSHNNVASSNTSYGFDKEKRRIQRYDSKQKTNMNMSTTDPSSARSSSNNNEKNSSKSRTTVPTTTGMRSPTKFNASKSKSKSMIGKGNGTGGGMKSIKMPTCAPTVVKLPTTSFLPTNMPLNPPMQIPSTPPIVTNPPIISPPSLAPIPTSTPLTTVPPATTTAPMISPSPTTPSPLMSPIVTIAPVVAPMIATISPLLVIPPSPVPLLSITPSMIPSPPATSPVAMPLVTTIPVVVPTNTPVTMTIPVAPTPTSGTPVMATPFSVNYSPIASNATPDDFQAATDVTCTHIEQFIIENFDFTPFITLEDVTCMAIETTGTPTTISYTVDALFGADSTMLPNQFNIDELITVALLIPEVDNLITALNGLPVSNPLSKTTGVMYDTSAPLRVAAPSIALLQHPQYKYNNNGKRGMKMSKGPVVVATITPQSVFVPVKAPAQIVLSLHPSSLPKSKGKGKGMSHNRFPSISPKQNSCAPTITPINTPPKLPITPVPIPTAPTTAPRAKTVTPIAVQPHPSPKSSSKGKGGKGMSPTHRVPSIAPKQISCAPTINSTTAPGKSPASVAPNAPAPIPTATVTSAPASNSIVPSTDSTRTPTSSPVTVSFTPTAFPLTGPPATIMPVTAPSSPPIFAPTVVPLIAPTTAPIEAPVTSPIILTLAPILAPTVPTSAPVLTFAPIDQTPAPISAPTMVPLVAPIIPSIAPVTATPLITPNFSSTAAPITVPTAPSSAPVFGSPIILTAIPVKAPTAAPTTAPVSAPTKTPTKAPTKSTTTPPTLAPVPLPVPVPVPGINVKVSSFNVEYFPISSPATSIDFMLAADITCTHVEDSLRANFALNPFLPLVEITCNSAVVSSIPPTATVLYDVTVTFATTSTTVLTMDQIDEIIFVAFQNPQVPNLINDLNSLPSTNPFQTTATTIYSVAPAPIRAPDGLVTSNTTSSTIEISGAYAFSTAGIIGILSLMIITFIRRCRSSTIQSARWLNQPRQLNKRYDDNYSLKSNTNLSTNINNNKNIDNCSGLIDFLSSRHAECIAERCSSSSYDSDNDDPLLLPSHIRRSKYG